MRFTLGDNMRYTDLSRRIFLYLPFRSVSDEVTVSQLLPNYTVYQELAAASQLLTTGRIRRPGPAPTPQTQ